MPVQRCEEQGGPGWQCEAGGKCFTYPAGDTAAERLAKQKAIDASIATGDDPGFAAVEELVLLALEPL